MNDLQVVEQELSDAIMREMRQAMQTKNISLTLLADMSGVPLETVERLESGRWCRSNLQKVRKKNRKKFRKSS